MRHFWLVLNFLIANQGVSSDEVLIQWCETLLIGTVIASSFVQVKRWLRCGCEWLNKCHCFPEGKRLNIIQYRFDTKQSCLIKPFKQDAFLRSGTVPQKHSWLYIKAFEQHIASSKVSMKTVVASLFFPVVTYISCDRLIILVIPTNDNDNILLLTCLLICDQSELSIPPGCVAIQNIAGGMQKCILSKKKKRDLFS